jgi:hypothetical protein
MPLPEYDEAFLIGRSYTWDLVAAPSEQLLIIRNYQLPEGKYRPAVVDLLVRIPAGYPTSNPDMFYMAQAVNKSDGSLPQAVTETNINGSIWHQWSRHYPSGTWRAGIDTLENYMVAVWKELEKGI